MNTSNTAKEKHYIDLPIFDGTVPSELSADYILPDTYPDVKRILRVSARPVLIERYISGKRLEYSGAVDYTVLFSAENDDGETLKCVHFAGDFNGTLGELEGLDTANISIAPRVISCSARLSNPRKLSIKSSLASDIMIVGSFCCDPRIEANLPHNSKPRIEQLTKQILSCRPYTVIAEPFRMSEDIQMDSTLPPVDELITCTSKFIVSEAKPVVDSSDASILIKGNIIVDCLYKAVGEPAAFRIFSKALPFSYDVRADECLSYYDGYSLDSLTANASITETELNADMGEDSYGEKRILELDLTAEVTLNMFCCHNTQLTLDAYSPGHSAECVTEQLTAVLQPKMFNQSFSVSENVSISETGLSEKAVPIYATARLTTDSLSITRGRASLAGKADISMICSDRGSFVSAQMSIPLRFEINTGDISEPFSYFSDMNASDIRVRIDGEKICFDFETAVCLRISEKTRAHAVKSVNVTGDAALSSRRGRMTICYPAVGESTWDIAKRYGIRRDVLEAANQNRGKVMVIPDTDIKSFVM